MQLSTEGSGGVSGQKGMVVALYHHPVFFVGVQSPSRGAMCPFKGPRLLWSGHAHQQDSAVKNSKAFVFGCFRIQIFPLLILS